MLCVIARGKGGSGIRKVRTNSLKIGFDSFSKIKVRMMQNIGSENGEIDESENWNETIWHIDLVQAIRDAFNNKYEEFKTAMSVVIGESLFEQTFPQYEEQWKKKVDLYYDGKTAELKRKCKVVLYSCTTVRLIQEKILGVLTQKAALIRKNFADSNQVIDTDKLKDDQYVIEMFSNVFKPECKAELEKDMNISVFHAFKKIVRELSPPIPYNVDIDEWNWIIEDGEKFEERKE